MQIRHGVGNEVSDNPQPQETKKEATSDAQYGKEKAANRKEATNHKRRLGQNGGGKATA